LRISATTAAPFMTLVPPLAIDVVHKSNRKCG
jgi:hypothetical protein